MTSVDINYIRNNYVFSHIICEGTAGKVYQVCPRDKNEVYALKCSYIDEIAKSQCLNEWMIVSQVGEHENIIGFHQCYITIASIFILQDYGKEDLHMNPNVNIKEVMRGIFQGLKYLKACHVIHRDIKRENILMKDGVPKIIDYGYSVISHNEYYEDDVYLDVVGTLEYVCAEVLSLRRYNFSQDMHAAGIILYELMTGYNPYTEHDYVKLNDNILENKRLYDNHIGNNLARSLIDKCIGISGVLITPEERYTPDQALEHEWLTNVHI